MERLVELGRLLDWYGALLTKRQYGFAKQYAYEDCSLAEIAEREGVSRQAVRDSILTAESEMLEFEQKLGLIRKNAKARALLTDLAALSTTDEQKEKIRSLYELMEDDDGI